MHDQLQKTLLLSQGPLQVLNTETVAAPRHHSHPYPDPHDIRNQQRDDGHSASPSVQKSPENSTEAPPEDRLHTHAATKFK